MKNKLSSALLTLALLGVSAYPLEARPLPAQGKTIEITDLARRMVKVPLDPARIVCIGPGSLRLVVYLNASSKVVGVEEMERRSPKGRPYWLAHPELAKLPCIGPGGVGQAPDLEATLRVKPQVILASYLEPATADKIQHKLGIPVVILQSAQLAHFDKALAKALPLAGKILNREQRSQRILAYIDETCRDLSQRTHGIPKKTGVYVGGIGFKGSHGIESTERDYPPLRWVGANNLAERITSRLGSHVFVDKEALLKLNPETIFIDQGGMEMIKADYRKKPGFYRALGAFQAKRVYSLLPYNFYSTNIETAIIDGYGVGKVLYPARFKDVDLAKKADAIYSAMVGGPVYKQMQRSYGPVGGLVPFL